MMPFHRSRTATTAWLGVLTVAVAACARPQAATGTRDEKAAAVARLKPTDSGSLAQTDARAHTPVAAGCVPTEHAEDIRRRLRAEAGEAFPFRRATPLLVDRWPDPTALVVYTYESRALPTGRVNHEIRSPEWMLRISPLGAPVVATHMRSVEKLGREDDHAVADDSSSRLRDAEEALVEVVGGCRPAAQACKALEPYKTWYAANPVIGRHLTGHLGVVFPCLHP